MSVTAGNELQVDYETRDGNPHYEQLHLKKLSWRPVHRPRLDNRKQQGLGPPWRSVRLAE